MEVLKFLDDWRTIIVCAVNGAFFRLRKWLGLGVRDNDAIQSLYDTLDPTSITYSQVWEDPRTLRRGLALSEGDRVICVCSGGDNALALLAEDPELVLAVDFSPAQVAVGELKKQAIKHLNYNTFLYLMGVGSQESSMTREQIYDKYLRPELGPKIRAFWDEHKGGLSGGLIHQGLYEKYFHTFGKAVRPLAHSLTTVQRFMNSGVDKRKDMYDDVINTWLWRFLVKLYFGDVLVGRCPAFYERSDVNVGTHFMSRVQHVMRDVDVSDNYYLEYILTGEMSGQFGLPEFMQYEHFTTLKQRADKVVFVEGDILNILENSESPFDAIDLSNIFDFVPLSTHNRYKKAVIARAAPGCRVCHWTFVPVSEKRVDWSSFGPEAIVDTSLSNELNAIERAWFYQTFIVQNIGIRETKKKEEQINNPRQKNGLHKNGIKKA